eukprot:TRINITY_DN758_c0_g1_i1.p1 TRINITY_DN758_c0_g1~~TRINITY_DN758_c0_g1_i1.p1  ORF type:complete len:157 (+),score=4.37 TRINITY_DN758_c0_g1_i1:207-677(+)
MKTAVVIFTIAALVACIGMFLSLSWAFPHCTEPLRKSPAHPQIPVLTSVLCLRLSLFFIPSAEAKHAPSGTKSSAISKGPSKYFAFVIAPHRVVFCNLAPCCGVLSLHPAAPRRVRPVESFVGRSDRNHGPKSPALTGRNFGNFTTRPDPPPARLI